MAVNNYVNLKDGLILPSPSPNYLLQNYAYQLYRLLDRYSLADRDAIKKPLDITKLCEDKVYFITELFGEALLRTITSHGYGCLRYCGGKVVDIDIATITRPRLTFTLNEAKNKCKIESVDAALLRILVFLPNYLL